MSRDLRRMEWFKIDTHFPLLYHAIFPLLFSPENMPTRTSLMVQWLRLHGSTPERAGSSSLAREVPHATLCGQKKKWKTCQLVVFSAQHHFAKERVLPREGNCKLKKCQCEHLLFVRYCTESKKIKSKFQHLWSSQFGRNSVFWAQPEQWIMGYWKTERSHVRQKNNV